MVTKVLLVEDHDIVREGLRSLLAKETSITIVGEASNGEEALKQIARTDPDVVVMDLSMPVMNGIECTRRISREFPTKKVLILSMHDQEKFFIDLLDAGADGYLLKSANRDELVFAISKVAAGGMYIAPEFTMNMLSKYRAVEDSQTPVHRSSLKITDREMEVLNRIGQGKTNAQIAAELFTSVRTIETRRKKLLEKTNTTNTATLIRFAVKNHIIP